MVFRVIQAFGSSVGMTVGTGVIADIYRLEERGTAMGVFLAVGVHYSCMVSAHIVLFN